MKTTKRTFRRLIALAILTPFAIMPSGCATTKPAPVQKVEFVQSAHTWFPPGTEVHLPAEENLIGIHLMTPDDLDFITGAR